MELLSEASIKSFLSGPGSGLRRAVRGEGISVIKMPKGSLEVLKALLLRNGGAEEPTTNPSEFFRLKVGDEKLIAYESGKVVSNGPRSSRLLYKAAKEVLKAQAQAQRREQEFPTIGSDEAGKGEWLGPLVVAAVALGSEDSLELRLQGVMDSKLLKLERIRELASMIRKRCLAYKVLTIGPQRFNELLKEVRGEGGSLNDLLTWAHARAIKATAERLGEGPFRIVVDRFDGEELRERLSRLLELRIDELILQTKAEEEEVAVAAASILARAAREKWIDDAGRRLGLALRELSPQDALALEDAHTIVKLGYLRRIKEQQD